MKYDVCIAEQRIGVVSVEASNIEEAKRKAIEECCKYNGIPSGCYIDDVQVDAVDCKEVKKKG